MKVKLIFTFLLLTAGFGTLSAQTVYRHEVDSLVAEAPAYNEYNEMRRALFKTFPTSTADIIFMGDSITDRCEWDELLGNGNVHNRGISADRVRWMFDRYEDIANGHPAKLFFLGGINDLRSGRTKSHDVVIMIAELLDRFHRISPETHIYLESILPVNMEMPAMQKFNKSDMNVRINNCNAWLSKWCSDKDYITFINVAPALKDANGQLNEAYTLDGLHPNSVGYMIWKDVIKGFVDE